MSKWIEHAIFGLSLACWLGFSSPSFAVSLSDRIPVLHVIGVVPSHNEAESTGHESKKIRERSNYEKDFSKAVRASRRFHVLDDDLVLSLWETKSGRQELKKQFELDALASLVVESRGDTVTLTARLLSPDLEIFLQEGEAHDAAEMRDQETVDGILEALVFRLFNRLPIDVSITSVQGPYVTISGGDEQGVRVDDEISIIRAMVKAKHPANGSWVDFTTQTLGKAQIIEVKRFASVAKLLSLVRENAVEVGDGARVPAIAGRAKFSRLAVQPEFSASDDGHSAIMPPVLVPNASRNSRGNQENKTQSSGKVAEEKSHNNGEVANPKPGEKVRDVPSVASSQRPSGSEERDNNYGGSRDGEGVQEDSQDDRAKDDKGFDVTKIAENLFEDVVVKVGAYTWSASGAVEDSGKFPVWLLNHLTVDMTRPLMMNFKVGFSGGGALGAAKNGSYTEYEGKARIFWEQEIPGWTPLLKKWRAGGEGGVFGLAIPKGQFGGCDLIQGGGFGSLHGVFNVSEDPQPYEWYGKFGIQPLDIGLVGILGKKSEVESAFGWSTEFGVFRQSGAPKNEFEYGGSLEYGANKLTLSKGRLQINEFSLMAQARYKL